MGRDGTLVFMICYIRENWMVPRRHKSKINELFFKWTEMEQNGTLPFVIWYSCESRSVLRRMMETGAALKKRCTKTGDNGIVPLNNCSTKTGREGVIPLEIYSPRERFLRLCRNGFEKRVMELKIYGTKKGRGKNSRFHSRFVALKNWRARI